MRSRSMLALALAAGLATVPSTAAAADSEKERRRLVSPLALTRLAAASGPTDTAPALADAVAALTAGDDRGLRTAVRLATDSPEETDSAAIAAAPTTAPVFTSPAAGTTVAGSVTATVNSGASHVRFTLPAVGFTADVPVTDGAATAQVPTWGTDGEQTLFAADCDGAGACGTPSSVNVTVDNPAPALTRPSGGAVVGTSFTAAATTTGGGVKFLLDGAPATTDTAPPFEQTLYTDGLAAGQHTITAVQCNEAGTTCADGKPSAPVTIAVKKRLTPSITSVSPSPFSPGKDGRRDTSTVSYRLETAQVVTWRVTNASGSTVVPARSLGAKSDGTHRFTFAGKKPGGTYLPSGRYTVHLDTSKAVTDSTLYGHAMRTVVIDRTAPRASSVAASPATVYPVKDGYRDTTTFRGRLSERVTGLTAQVFTSSGRKVRSIAVGGRAAGPVAVSWNGRRANGSLVPEGGYRFRFVMQDLAGNRSASTKDPVTVSHKKLEKRTGKKTVTAYGSATTAYKGACSDLFSPGARGWAKSVGYYSDFYGCSYYEGDDLAAANHAITLPNAVKYGTVRISAYGGKALDSYNDEAGLLYYDGVGDLTSTGRVLNSAVKTYDGPAVGSRFVSRTGRVRWMAATIEGNYYDIKSFTVRYSYFVLR